MASAGQVRGRTSAKGARRRSAAKAQPRAAGRFDAAMFRVQVRRPREGKIALATLTIGNLVTEVSWARSGAVQTGSLTFEEPEGRWVPGILLKGDVVRLLAQDVPGGKWRLVWEMIAAAPVQDIAGRTWSADLSAKLEVAQKSRKGWRYAKDRKHKQGWRADEVARAAAQRMKVPLGDIVKGGVRLPTVSLKSGGVLDIVTKAYKMDRSRTARRYDVTTARGVLDVVELRRPAYMLPIGRYLIGAEQLDGINQKFASAVVVTSVSKSKTGKKRRRVRVTVVDKSRVRRYGYIERKVTENGLTSRAAARKFGKRWLARVATPIKEIRLEHPGIPWVNRGDAFDLSIARIRLRKTVWVKGVEHTLTSSGYTMSLVLSVEDPWERNEREDRAKRQRIAAAKKRKRKTNESAGGSPRKPAKAGRRR